MAWSGEEYGITWRMGHHPPEERRVAFAAVSRQGRFVGEVRRVNDGRGRAEFPVLVGHPGGFGVAYWAHRDDGWSGVAFQRLAPDGGSVGAEVPVVGATFPELEDGPLSLTWNGAGYGVVWNASEDDDPNYANSLYFASGPFGCP